jgi:DNA-binding transcriptional LysR family regulator
MEHAMDRLAAMTTFVRVVDAGSFSAAARVLGIGQPAVSKIVAQLENRLAVRLLIRSTRGLTPTEAGLRFYEHARRSIEEADVADFSARDAGTGLSGALRVSAPTTFARLHVVPHLGAFMAAHPSLAIDLILDDRPIDLVGEGIDVSLRIGTLQDSAATARRIGRSPRSALATRDYIDRAGEPASPAALAEHEAVVFTRGRSGAWVFRRGTAEVSVEVAGRLRVSSAEGLRAAVLAGLGLAVVSQWMFAPELADGRVVRFLPDWTLPPVDIWAVYPTGRMATAKARAFVAFVESRIP